MVNSTGFLDDADLASSPPPRDVEEDDDYGKYSDAASEPEGYGEDSDEADGEEEVSPTHRDWEDIPLNISITEPSRSGANPSGSGI